MPLELRRPWTYATLAVAGAAAVAVPLGVLLTPNDGRGHDLVPASGSPTTVPAIDPEPPRGPGAGWPVTDRMVADVDGDGRGDRVLLRQSAELPEGPARVEVQLSSNGANVWTIVRRHRVGYTLAGLADVDHDGADDILLYLRPSPGDVNAFAVFVLDDGELRRA
jgi:hypothetical protein